ncbi:MAG: LysE family translocator [Anaerolineales bacterium]|nr:LysE family translocator [Anaerolineales bacterium]
MQIFLKGLLLGFSIAAPVGPIGVLCIRRTLAEGRLVGFLSGLGAASADMLYGAIAAFGLSALQALLVGQANWLRIFGGIFLIYLGVKTFLSKPAEQAAGVSRGGIFGAYLSTFLLTLTNPMTILSFIAIFAGLQINTSGNYLSPILLVAGVFCGSAAWWLTLSFLVGQVRGRLEAGRMVWVNRISGVVILSFGIAALLIKTTGI